jgi:hypothetical protein
MHLSHCECKMPCVSHKDSQWFLALLTVVSSLAYPIASSTLKPIVGKSNDAKELLSRVPWPSLGAIHLRKEHWLNDEEDHHNVQL